MRIGDPIDSRIPWIRAIGDLEEARATRLAGPRLTALRRAAEALGDELRDGPRVVAIRTLPLRKVLYPTKHAFNGAVPMPFPFIVFFHRCLLVQVLADGHIRNVLWNPTDTEASKQTPYYHKLIDRFGERASDLLSPFVRTAESYLEELGLSADDIDVVAFDHFHTQDLRSLPSRFPNALLLAPRIEWEDWDDLHPMQRAWFVPNGKEGVPGSRVVLFDADVRLGDGAVILRTHGHTTGNQTLFCHADGGVFGCSENGTSADNWSPHESRLPGMRRYAKQYDVEVVLNSNTPELGGEQYTSMIVERSMVDRVADRPGFVQMFPSSEVIPSAIAPGIRPSMVFGERTSGTISRPAAGRTRPAAAAAAPAE